MSMTPEDWGKFIMHVLDAAARMNVFPSEDAVEKLKPYVDAIHARYGDLRPQGFCFAHDTSRAEFITGAIAQAIRQAEDDKLEEAARVAENPGFIEATDTAWDSGVNFAKPFIAKAIRALKHKDT